jgi:hypothetical protein
MVIYTISFILIVKSGKIVGKRGHRVAPEKSAILTGLGLFNLEAMRGDGNDKKSMFYQQGSNGTMGN